MHHRGRVGALVGVQQTFVIFTRELGVDGQPQRRPVVVQAAAPGLASTVYPEIVLPPSRAGALQETVAVPMPAMADAPVGAPGTVLGVTAFGAIALGPGPTALTATTPIECAMPLSSPMIVQVKAPPDQAQVRPPGHGRQDAAALHDRGEAAPDGFDFGQLGHG